ncbi:condensation domain-containing protein [Streptomyces sp. NPDC059650]|uniref:condensation domain-containing protein n=1 Tax=Streptomyces sp. NPDC059650 TaxID=3346896 RepID=UPI00368C7923
MTTVLEDGSRARAPLAAAPGPARGADPDPGPGGVPLLPRPAVRGPRHFAASPSQEALWSGLADRTAPPVVLGALRLTGRLDVPALAAAWRTVSNRHETLRSGYRMHGGVLTQVVSGEPQWPLPVSLAEVLPSQVAKAIAAERELPFDLARGPLARLRLLRRGPGDHVAVFVLHHLIADSAALELLVAELAAAYRGVLPDRPAAQYADVAAWQRQRSAEGHDAESTRYWRRRLSGAEPAVLPWDLAPPGGAEHTAGIARTLSFPLPPELVAKIAEAARRHGTSVQVVGLTAFQLLLACWSGQRDVCVRVPVPERGRAGEPPMLARLSEAVVQRTDLTGTPSFGEVVDQVRLTSAWDFAHHGIPLEPVAAQMRRPGLVEQLGHVQFGGVDAPPAGGPRWGAVPWGGRLRAEPFAICPGPAARPLALLLRHDGQTARFAVTFDSALFSEARIRQLGADYTGMLTDVADHPRERFR